MLRLALRRGLVGLPWGIAISQIIALAVSAAGSGGSFYLFTPELVERMGTELNAAILQTILCALLGFLWGILSIIWQIESWSLLRQSAVFFILGLGGTLTAEYLCGWVDFGWASLLRFLGIFTAVFAVVWIVLYNWYRLRIRAMNEKIRRQTKR